MHTLLIAEDEKLIRAGIRAMVQRSGVPVDHIYEANNGQKALEILQSGDLEVLFTDIRMPVMDGIELVKQASQLPRPPLMVAISGFDDFTYAVEMLRNGVQEYLLKPLEREKVREILQKLDNKLDVLRQESRLRKYQQLVSGDYRLLMTMLHPDLIGGYDCVQVPYDSDGCALLIEASRAQQFIEDEIVEETVGISRIHHGEDEIKNAYYEAALARQRAFCIEKPVKADDTDDKVPESLRQSALEGLSDNSVTQRVQIIGAGSEKDLTYLWHKFFEEARRGYTEPKAFFDCQTRSIAMIEKLYCNSISNEMMEKLNQAKKFSSFSGLSKYEDFFLEIIMLINHQLMKENEEPSLKKINEAVAYTREHFSEDLNMAVVSNYISMNYTLFSLSFKKYTGENFVSFLKNLRLNKARQLLENTDERITDISHEVGYENEKHFSKLFKSELGVSPVDYRNNIRRNQT